MTDVTTGFASSHAREMRAGPQSCVFAIGAITPRIFHVLSLSPTGKTNSDRRDGVVGLDLVEIDVVCLEAAKAGFHRIHNVSTRGANVIAARADTRVNLRRKHDVLAGNVEILEGLPKGRLTFTLREYVCCIEEINAAVDRRLDQFVGSLLVDGTDDLVDALAATKGHSAQGNARNEESCIA